MDRCMCAAGSSTALAVLAAIAFVVVAVLPSEQCGLDAAVVSTIESDIASTQSLASASSCTLGKQPAALPEGKFWSTREVRALYSTIDVDSNRLISRDEFRNFLETISMLDKNLDLVISRAEFDSRLRSMSVVAEPENFDEKLLIIFKALDSNSNNELSKSEAQPLAAAVPDVYLQTDTVSPFDYSKTYEICIGCLAGKYRNASSGDTCMPCETGFYAAGSGATATIDCVACGPGMTTAFSGAESCTCKPGWSPRCASGVPWHCATTERERERESARESERL